MNKNIIQKTALILILLLIGMTVNALETQSLNATLSSTIQGSTGIMQSTKALSIQVPFVESKPINFETLQVQAGEEKKINGQDIYVKLLATPLAGRSLCAGKCTLSAAISARTKEKYMGQWTITEGQKVRVENTSIKLGEVTQTGAVLEIETTEYKQFQQIPVQPSQGVSSGIGIPPRPAQGGNSGTTESQNAKSVPSQQAKDGSMQVRIGNDQTYILVKPQKVISVTQAAQESTSFEVSPEVDTARKSTEKINSISINPNEGKIIADVQTKTGSLVQEIPQEYLPQVGHDGMQIEANPEEKNILIRQGQSVAQTEHGIKILGNDVYIETEKTKQKISIFPEQAAQIISEKTKTTQALQVFGATSMQAESSKASGAFSIPRAKVNLEVINDKPVYTFSETEYGKILGIVNASFDVKVKIDAQTGQTTVEKPFWTIFVVR